MPSIQKYVHGFVLKSEEKCHSCVVLIFVFENENIEMKRYRNNVLNLWNQQSINCKWSDNIKNLYQCHSTFDFFKSYLLFFLRIRCCEKNPFSVKIFAVCHFRLRKANVNFIRIFIGVYKIDLKEICFSPST